MDDEEQRQTTMVAMKGALPDLIPTEIWTDAVLGGLDARDVAAVLVALGPRRPVHFQTTGAVFAAKRVLLDCEIAWFDAHGIAVQMLSERRTFTTLPELKAAFPQYAWPDDAIPCTVSSLNGKIHSRELENGGGAAVAVELSNGDLIWMRAGEHHRDNDLPAVEYANGDRLWFVHGQLHRDNDRPADVRADGLRGWWVRGERHRDGDLPALEWPAENGLREWYFRGHRHRENDMPAVENDIGDRQWFQDGQLHRDGDMPADVWANGAAWWVHGKKHRDFDRPAVVNSNGGDRGWYKEGKLHRDNGLPAVIRADGSLEWWLNDEQQSQWWD